MKCRSCGAEMDLLEVLDTGRIFECAECSCTVTVRIGRGARVAYSGPPPLDYYYHD